MNLSYNWLKSLVDFDLSPEALAAELTRVGCCVEEMHPVGTDTMLVAEVTTNRPDWLCHWGVAHEIAAFTGAKLTLPEIALPEPAGDPVTGRTSVTNEAPDLCPRYTARLITGVEVGPSPDWLIDRLEAIGLKPRNNVVDATNYVLMEMNQPLHAFDFDRLAEHRIVVRHAAEGEPFTSVFEEERKLDSGMCVIADGTGPVALAGIKGGLGSSVQDDTVNILLESAYFDPGSTRRSSRRAQLDSDSSYRFERGIDPGGVERASARACQLILEIAGGTLAPGIIDTRPDLAAPWEVAMRWDRCTQLLGLEVPRDRIRTIFTGLGLAITKDDEEAIDLAVPTFREDLTREADLIEEVARCHGFENIPTALTMPVAVSHEPAHVRARRVATEVLVGLGYHECLTDTFVPAGWNREAVALAPGDPVRVRNPVREDRPLLRSSLVPSLLEVRRVNRGQSGVRLFEIGRTFLRTGPETTEEPERLAITDDRQPQHLRGALEAILRELRVEGDLAVEPVLEPQAGFADGTTARMRIGQTQIALFGQLSDALTEAHDLHEAPSMLIADFGAIADLPRRGRLFRPLPRFPGVVRDIALVVPEAVRWADVESAVQELPDQIEAVEFQSVYRGKQVGPGRKSIAFSILYRHPERSLTDEEANALRDRMIEHLTTRIEGSELRA
jgi:phenylalanyl-tRNA synthetase beta chain